MVYLFLAEGFEDIEAVAPLDILSRAGIPTQTVGVGGREVVSSHGLCVKADMTEDEVSLSNLDMVILPGGPGVDNLRKAETVRYLVQNAFFNEKYIAAICAAPTLLAEWGILAGYQAVCYPGMEDRLEAGGATVIWDKKVVLDRKLICGQAAGASVEFGLKIVEVLKDADTAERIQRAIHYGG